MKFFVSKYIQNVENENSVIPVRSSQAVRVLIKRRVYSIPVKRVRVTRQEVIFFLEEMTTYNLINSFRTFIGGTNKFRGAC